MAALLTKCQCGSYAVLPLKMARARNVASRTLSNKWLMASVRERIIFRDMAVALPYGCESIYSHFITFHFHVPRPKYHRRASIYRASFHIADVNAPRRISWHFIAEENGAEAFIRLNINAYRLN